MARRRMIDPKFWGDETIGKLEPQERLFYIGLFSLADDEGRICGSPGYLRSQIYPYDDIPLDVIVTWITRLEKIGLIHTYDDPSGNNNTYIDHPKWFKYQTINRPQPSLLPPCPKFRSHHRKSKPTHGTINDDSVNPSVNESRPEEVKRSEVKRSEKKKLREEKGREGKTENQKPFSPHLDENQKHTQPTKPKGGFEHLKKSLTSLDKLNQKLKEQLGREPTVKEMSDAIWKVKQSET